MKKLILVSTFALLASLSVSAFSAAIFEDDFQGANITDKWIIESGNIAQFPDDWNAGNTIGGSGNSGAYLWMSTVSQFTDTAYTVKWNQFYYPGSQGPQLRMMLLRQRDENGTPIGLASYELLAYPLNGAVLVLTRVNADGTTDSLVDNDWSVAHPCVSMGYWNTGTASVVVKPTSTDLSFTFQSINDGAPISYNLTYSDTSEKRLTTGKGIGVHLYSGDTPSGNAPNKDVYIDNIVVTPILSSLVGNVTVADYTTDPIGLGITVELLQNSNVVRTEHVNLAADGSFSIADVAPGVYDVAVKGASSLRKLITGIDCPVAGEGSIGSVVLTNGDVDGDNEITSTDLSILGLNLGLAGD